MRRDIPRLADSTFDLLIVGAGIYGACAAWDAALRGLSVAVVDQEDFGAATSANSLRIVHGGLRYLVRGDLSRMRESIRERSTLLRIAPGLVQPLPVLVPTYGSGARGRAAHAAALALNDLVSLGRNRHLNRTRSIPRGHLISREECLSLFPWFVAEGLTGGAIWYDAQLRHPERLTFSFLQAAANIGAVPANYVRVDRLLVSNGAVEGAEASDRLTGAGLRIRARAVLVAAGPWTEEVLASIVDAPQRRRGRQALAVNLVVDRRLAEVAFGVRARTSRHEDPVCGGSRFLFSAPHGQVTLLGTWYTADATDAGVARERGLRELLREFNDACPGLDLSEREVLRCQSGWLPLKDGRERGRADALAERPRIVHYGPTLGIRNLLSVEGVKFTTARLVAEQAVTRVFTSLGRTSPPCRTAELRLHGTESGVAAQAGATQAGRGEIVRAVREEMAVKLSDIVFRRTALGAAPGPERTAVEAAARIAGAELGWDLSRQDLEVTAVMRELAAPGPVLEPVG